jgi:hypothetical protein
LDGARGPAVKAPIKRGFGSKLIEQTVKSEGGSARTIVETNTLHWDISLPLPCSPMPSLAPTLALDGLHEGKG